MGTYKLVTDNKNTFFTNNKLTIGTAAPTSGTHAAGDLVISSSANSTAFGWVCTAAGTPGTWKVLKSGSDVTLSSLGAAASSHTHNYAASTSAGGGASGVVVSNDTSNKLYLTGVTATTANSGTVRTSTPYMAGGTITATTFSGALSGNATTATTLKNARNITIGNKTNSFNGSAAISFTLSDIGAAAASHTHSYLPLTGGELSGRLSAWGHLSLPTSGGMWITGMDITKPSIGVTTQQTSGSYHPVLGVMTYSGNYVNLGGINNDFGFYGYDYGRTENGIDWQFSFDTANKIINTDMDIYAKANTGYFGALVLSNNHSLYGTGTNGAMYNICGLDSSNHVYIGWGSEAYTDHRNTSFFHDAIRIKRNIGEMLISVYDNPVRTEFVWYNSSLGDWDWANKFYFDVNGQFYAGKQVSIAGHRITPYSENGVSIINPAGSEFSGLEVKELWIGPYTGATYKFVVSPSAPSSPSWGTVWVQNG